MDSCTFYVGCQNGGSPEWCGLPGTGSNVIYDHVHDGYAVKFYKQPTPNIDVGVSRIIVPSGGLDSGTVVIPACSLYNYGDVSETYTARMKIGTSYDTAVSVSGHMAGACVYVTFPTWLASPPGSVAFSCSTELTGDIDPANDKMTGMVTVCSLEPGWTQLSPVPGGPANKGIKDGAALACAGGAAFDETHFVYALKSNGTLRVLSV